MLSIREIIEKSFLEGFAANDITLTTFIVALLATALVAAYIFVIYKLLCRKTFYSKNFNMSLVGVALITAAIIITIQSSLVVSLGMVGALSIVRFRTAIKDPLDLMFLFWAISTGIICGAGYAEYAVVLAIILTIVVVVIDRLPISKAPMILMVEANSIEIENSILKIVEQYSRHYTVKARNVSVSELDLTVEIATKDVTDMVKKLTAINGVSNVSVLAHDGEVTF
ncbi:DUF4956 domain-containing protein [Butyrivibrio sp. MC2021]|uniref:DUF4956 domain-containing protein n=1 Tax=Butyrivibrio sp. MC2021 TaxID=1408306 RepID=UPI00055C94D9|nr:DUF4956 domain-containing protein [Butyrivibrio sp. MC2021]